jgi:PIN domain nuclease of toxin-antitoxin system
MLLDTHFIIWYFTNQPCLRGKERTLIQQTIQKDTIYISAISFLEIAMLQRKKKLQIILPLKEWFETFINSTGVTTLPLSLDIALESYALPGTFHPDPADRILVATARLHRIPLLTRDTQILNYGSANHVMLASPHAE